MPSTQLNEGDIYLRHSFDDDICGGFTLYNMKNELPWYEQNTIECSMCGRSLSIGYWSEGGEPTGTAGRHSRYYGVGLEEPNVYPYMFYGTEISEVSKFPKVEKLLRGFCVSHTGKVPKFPKHKLWVHANLGT